MPSAVLAPSVCVLEALRGDPSQRPRRDTTTATGLRAVLEDGLFAISHGDRRATPLVVGPDHVTTGVDVIDITHATYGRLRGALVAQLVRHYAVGYHPEDPFDAAVRAWTIETPAGELTTALADLDDNARSRLATDVSAHAVCLRRALAETPVGWTVRTAVRTRLRLGGGDVVLRDTLDLVVGTADTARTSVVLVDVTTAPIGERTDAALRYHALTHTLRTSVTPLRAATFSTATGTLTSHEVDYPLLGRAVDELLDTMGRRWAT